MPISNEEWAARVEAWRERVNDLEVKCDNLRIQLQNKTEEYDELKIENDAIMRMYAIESDTCVRDVIERMSNALYSWPR